MVTWCRARPNLILILKMLVSPKTCSKIHIIDIFRFSRAYNWNYVHRPLTSLNPTFAFKPRLRNRFPYNAPKPWWAAKVRCFYEDLDEFYRIEFYHLSQMIWQEEFPLLKTSRKILGIQSTDYELLIISVTTLLYKVPYLARTQPDNNKSKRFVLSVVTFDSLRIWVSDVT